MSSSIVTSIDFPRSPSITRVIAERQRLVVYLYDQILYGQVGL